MDSRSRIIHFEGIIECETCLVARCAALELTDNGLEMKSFFLLVGSIIFMRFLIKTYINAFRLLTVSSAIRNKLVNADNAFVV